MLIRARVIRASPADGHGRRACRAAAVPRDICVITSLLFTLGKYAASRAAELRARMRSLWLLQHQRVGSTWLASTHLAQHPHIHMPKHGEGEACFGHFRRHRSNGSNVSCAGERQCFAQLLQHQDACKARKSRVCGWKAGANFCPTPRCASWLWSTLQPTVVHLYRRDMLRQAISLALARSSRIWTCRVGFFRTDT